MSVAPPISRASKRLRPEAPEGLSLVIPAWNEAQAIGQAIDEARAALERIVGRFEIIVVDDGSSDATAERVAAAAAIDPRVRLVRHPSNQGYGAALNSGMSAARLSRVAFTDADCQFDLADLGRLLALSERHDVVCGYRQGRRDPALRRFLSWGYNRLAWCLLGSSVRDIDCALKVFRRDVVPEILPRSRGFFANTEMLAAARRRRLSIAEIGVRHRPRCAGASKVSLGDVPRTLAALIPFWWRHVWRAAPEEA